MKRLIGIFVFLLLCSQPVAAATLYLDPAASTLARGDAEMVAVRLDTDEATNECVNAVEGVLELSGPVSAVDISLGNSIFSIWVEPPTISENGKRVTFAGGIANGYCGRIAGDPRLTNNLFDIIVRTTAIASTDESTVTGEINFTGQTVAYLNDGFGTVADLQVFPKEFTVLPNLSTDVQDPWGDRVAADTISPQEFSVTLEQTAKSLRERYYITFSTTDKQTGIDRYEVMEEPLSKFTTFNWGSASAPWVVARSPHVLKDQKLNSIIRVKAIDKAGNEYIATYVPDEALRSTPYSLIALLVLLGVSILVLIFGLMRFYKNKRCSRVGQTAHTEETSPAHSPVADAEYNNLDTQDNNHHDKYN